MRGELKTAMFYVMAAWLLLITILAVDTAQRFRDCFDFNTKTFMIDK